jgi:hypothetical protein
MLGVRLVILALTVVIALLCALLYRPKRHFLRERTPDRDTWTAMYGDERLPEVVEVLELVRRAFSLPKDNVFQLRPDDRLLEIYKAKYPYGGADELELEGLVAAVRQRYGVGLATRSDPGSVRELVEACIAARKSAV